MIAEINEIEKKMVMFLENTIKNPSFQAAFICPQSVFLDKSLFLII